MPRPRRFALIAVLVAALVSWSVEADVEAAPPPEASTRTPIAVVELLHDEILRCWKGECGPDFEDRRRRLLEVLDETFDLALMSRITLGASWRSLSEEERTSFLETQRLLSASNYASNFDSWGGQSFETLGEEPAARKTILVKTELRQPDDDDVRFDYRLRRVDGVWRIIDVTLDGKISEITLRRADYTAYLERNGFESLLTEIEKKIAKLETE